MSAKVVTLAVAPAKRAKLPDDFGQLLPAHALLVAIDVLGDRNMAFDAMLAAGFRERAVGMTWLNAAHRLGHVEPTFIDGVSEFGREEMLAWRISDAGQAALAQMERVRRRRPALGASESLPLFESTTEGGAK